MWPAGHILARSGLEAAVKQVKYLLIKSNGNFDLFCGKPLEWRNVPRADSYSPVQLFLGR